jgi:hypothetical protein
MALGFAYPGQACVILRPGTESQYIYLGVFQLRRCSRTAGIDMANQFT